MEERGYVPGYSKGYNPKMTHSTVTVPGCLCRGDDGGQKMAKSGHASF